MYDRPSDQSHGWPRGHCEACLLGLAAEAVLTASSFPPPIVHTFLQTISPVSIIWPCTCVSITYVLRALTVGSTPWPSLGGRLVIHTRSTTPCPLGVVSLSSRDACTTHESKLYVKLVLSCGSSNGAAVRLGLLSVIAISTRRRSRR